MPREAIKQAECQNCDDESAEFRVTDKDSNYGELEVTYQVTCSCEAEEVVTVDEEGTSATDGITYENATWNNVEEEDEEE